MSQLNITIDEIKKRLTFSADKIAFGEKVNVSLLDMDSAPEDLRLRVEFLGRTIAKFPLSETDDWTINEEGFVSCTLNLNTDLAVMIKGYADCKIILDNVDEGILYGVGTKEIMPWRKEEGEDVPYNLDNYPDVIEEFRKELDEWFAEQETNLETFKNEINSEVSDFKDEVNKTTTAFQNGVNKAIEGKANQTALETETTNREDADSLLREQISRNASSINSIQESINKEAATRKEADNLLGIRIANNTTLITSLGENVGTFKTENSEAHNALSSRISANEEGLTSAAERINENEENIVDIIKEVEKLNSGCIFYSKSQTLTEDQKQTACNNISALHYYSNPSTFYRELDLGDDYYGFYLPTYTKTDNLEVLSDAGIGGTVTAGGMIVGPIVYGNSDVYVGPDGNSVRLIVEGLWKYIWQRFSYPSELEYLNVADMTNDQKDQVMQFLLNAYFELTKYCLGMRQETEGETE